MGRARLVTYKELMYLLTFVNKNADTEGWNLLPNCCKSNPFLISHLDFGGIETDTAVYSMESDGVELSLVEVDHGQLTGLVW